MPGFCNVVPARSSLVKILFSLPLNWQRSFWPITIPTSSWERSSHSVLYSDQIIGFGSPITAVWLVDSLAVYPGRIDPSDGCWTPKVSYSLESLISLKHNASVS